MKQKPLKVIAGEPGSPLIIGNIEIECYVLEDETRVLSQRGVFKGIGAARGGTKSLGGAEVPRVMASNALSAFVSNNLAAALNSPIEFQPPSGGRTAYGYPAVLLVDMCDAVLRAHDAGALRKNQLHIAKRADILVRALATVGIIALVDEATGYQRMRSERALATILEEFIAKELQPWTRTFPYEFYQQIFRLKGWPGPNGTKRPSVIGHYTNDIVYARLAPGVLVELKQKNPTLPSGRRKTTHHRWFTPEFGHPKLKEHLAAVTAFMRAAANWTVFQRNLNRAFPKLNETITLPFDDE